MLRCVGRYKFGHDFYRESVGPMPIWMHKPACLGDEVSRPRVLARRGRQGARHVGGRREGQSLAFSRSAYPLCCALCTQSSCHHAPQSVAEARTLTETNVRARGRTGQAAALQGRTCAARPVEQEELRKPRHGCRRLLHSLNDGLRHEGQGVDTRACANAARMQRHGPRAHAWRRRTLDSSLMTPHARDSQSRVMCTGGAGSAQLSHDARYSKRACDKHL